MKEENVLAALAKNKISLILESIFYIMYWNYFCENFG
jgi:hypothetical protein